MSDETPGQAAKRARLAREAKGLQTRSISLESRQLMNSTQARKDSLSAVLARLAKLRQPPHTTTAESRER